jgi:hypothetical protein
MSYRQPPTEYLPLGSGALSLPPAGTLSAGLAMREGPTPSLLSLRADFRPDAWLIGAALEVLSAALEGLSVGGAGSELVRCVARSIASLPHHERTQFRKQRSGSIHRL